LFPEPTVILSELHLTQREAQRNLHNYSAALRSRWGASNKSSQ
jgi:hypothetical protein